MANTQKSAGHFKRTLQWFGRHKVTAVFTALLLALLVWGFCSWAVLQTQIHFERERYVDARNKFTKLKIVTQQARLYSRDQYSDCSYTDDGSIFAVKHLGCETGIRLVYTDVSKNDAIATAGLIKTVLTQKFGELANDQQAYEANDIGVYGFKVDNISCIYVATYYDQSNKVPLLPVTIPLGKSSTYVEIDCGGNARADYFPVTRD